MKSRVSTFTVVNTVFLVLVCITMLYPFWNTVAKSFSTNQEIMRGNVALWPRSFTLAGYQELISDAIFFRALWNTVIIVLAGVVLRVSLSMLAGYAFSKDQLRFRRPLFLMFIFTMFFTGGLVPTFLTIVRLGLYDTLWVLILFGGMPVYHMILAMSFFRSIPEAIEESAFVDGAGFTTIFRKIILPISKPLFATLIIFNAVQLYNLFMPAILFTQSPELTVLQVFVRLKVFAAEAMSRTLDDQALSLLDTMDTGSETLKMAVLSLSSIPIILIYPFFQRYFIKGVTLGAVKS